MGIVYRAIEVDTQEKVVLKLLLSNLQSQPYIVKLFEESAGVQKSLMHPNIAPILDIGKEGGISFIVQPYYEKGSLDRWFRQIDIGIVIQSFRKVCRAVQFAHEHGEVHGDIKSSNVLIGPEGQILLTDFMSSEILAQILRSSGIRWGTPIYMAPEILASQKAPDIKTDIYALGLLLFESVKGYLPRQIDERMGLASRVQREIPLHLEPKYSWINDIIHKAVHPAPEQRFVSVQEMLEDIQEQPTDYQWPPYIYTHTSAWLEFESPRSREELGASTYSIGSSDSCDIVIQTPGIVERHAEIDFRDDIFLIRRVDPDADLYLSSEMVRVARVLHRGDQIRMGNSRIRFVTPPRVITRQIGSVQLLPIGWVRTLEEENEEQLEITDTPVRLIDDKKHYIEIQPQAGKLKLLVTMKEPVLINQKPEDNTDLSEGDVIKYENKKWSIHYARDEWMEIIDRNLLAHGKVSEHHLPEIPSNCRLIAMREYAVERYYLDISFNADEGYLRCNDIQRLQLFRQLWADSRDTFDRRVGTEIVAELVELIKEKLFLSKGAAEKISEKLGSRYGGFMSFALNISTLAQGIDLPESIPLVLAKCQNFSPDSFSILLEAIRSPISAPQLAIIIFLDDITRLLTLEAIEQLERAHAIDILALGREDIQRILFARDPRRSLRSSLLSSVNLIQVSPFVTSGPVRRKSFFGREMEIRKISTKINRASFALIGGRRYGKTSLLLRLHNERLPNIGLRTIYHDCIITPTSEGLHNAIIRDWSPEPLHTPPTTFGDLLHSTFDEEFLVLLLDDVGSILSNDRTNGWPLFNTLRELAISGRIQFILSGSHTLRAALRDPNSPLFNFASEIPLGPLDYHAVEELVTRPMKQLEIDLADETVIVQRIYDFTAGHPNIVQRLCQRLIEQLSEQNVRRITFDDLEAVIKNPRFQEADFLQTYWEKASSLEKIITLVLSQEPGVYHLREIRTLLSTQTHIQPSATKTKEALDRLVEIRSILKRSQAGYTFAVEAFPQVLANSTTVEDLLEVFVEQYKQAE